MNIEIQAPGRRWESDVIEYFKALTGKNPLGSDDCESSASKRVLVGFPEGADGGCDGGCTPFPFDNVFGIWLIVQGLAAPLVMLPKRFSEESLWDLDGYKKYYCGLGKDELAWMLRIWMEYAGVHVKIDGNDVLESGLVPKPATGFEGAVRAIVQSLDADKAGAAESGDSHASVPETEHAAEAEDGEDQAAPGIDMTTIEDAALSISPTSLKWMTMKLSCDAQVSINDDDEAYALATAIYDDVEELKIPAVRDYNLIEKLEDAVCPPEEMCLAMAVSAAASTNGGNVSVRTVRDCMTAFYTEFLNARAEEEDGLPLSGLVTASGAQHDGLAAKIAWELDRPSNAPEAVDAALALGVAMLDAYLPADQRFDFGDARDFASAVEEQKAGNGDAEWDAAMPQGPADGDAELDFCGLTDDELLAAAKGFAMAEPGSAFGHALRAWLIGLLGAARRAMGEDDTIEDALLIASCEGVATVGKNDEDAVPSYADLLFAVNGDEGAARELSDAIRRCTVQMQRIVAVTVNAALRSIHEGYIAAMFESQDDAGEEDAQTEDGPADENGPAVDEGAWSFDANAQADETPDGYERDAFPAFDGDGGSHTFEDDDALAKALMGLNKGLKSHFGSEAEENETGSEAENGE